MGHYTTIIGWLEVGEHMLPEVKERILKSQERCSQYNLPPESAEFYLRGFVFVTQVINGSPLVFYGAGVRTYYVQFIEDIIREIAEQVVRTDGEFTNRPLGVFHVRSEDDVDQITIWHVARGRLEKRIEGFVYNP